MLEKAPTVTVGLRGWAMAARFVASMAPQLTMAVASAMAESTGAVFAGPGRAVVWRAVALWRWLLARRFLAPVCHGFVWSACAALGALAVRRVRSQFAGRRAVEGLPIVTEMNQARGECTVEQAKRAEATITTGTDQLPSAGVRDGLSESLLASSHSGWRTVRVVPLNAWRQHQASLEPFAHPHVAQLFSVTVCEHEQTVHIDCERTDSTVRQLVATHELYRLSGKTRLRLCAELASGLDAIHTHGSGNLWHGMLRDDTCLLVRADDGDWTAKLSEFGVIAERDTAEARLHDMRGGWWPVEAKTLVSLGSLASFDGKRIDIFGLGCVAAILLSADGQHPFGAEDQREQRIAMGTPVLSTLLRGWPISLLPFLLRMLGLPASRRPTSSEVLASMCAACEASSEASPAVATIRQDKCQVAVSSPTPLARAVASAGGLDKWQQWSPAARRAAINEALGQQNADSDTSFDEESVGMVSFTSQAEADVDEFLAQVAELAVDASPGTSSSTANPVPSMLSTGEAAFGGFGESAEEAVDAFLVDLAQMVEADESSVNESAETPEQAIDDFLVDLAQMVEADGTFVSESAETPEQAIDAFLVDLAETIEAQLVESPVPATSPAWRIQEQEASEYLRDVSLREEDSIMSLTRAAMNIASTPSKAAAAAADVLDQALTDLEVAAVGRIEHAVMKDAETPTKAALAAANVIQLAMDELETNVPLRSPVSPDSLGQITRPEEMRWSSPSDAIASPVSKELGTRRELMLAEVARRNMSAGNSSSVGTPPAAMPPVPAQLVRKDVKPADTCAKESTITSDGRDDLAIAQSQVDNFLSDIKTITLSKAVEHAIASAGSNQTESSEPAEQKDEVSDDISPTSRVYTGHSGVRRRIAMTKRFTQLKDTLASDEGACDSLVASSPTRRGDAAEPQSCDEAAPLSPRSAADKASRERTRQLGARLLALAKRKPGLAKVVEARGLFSNKSAVALSSSVRSPSNVETLVRAPAELCEKATKLKPRSLEQHISSKRLSHTWHSASGMNMSLRSGTLMPSPALGQSTASFNTSSISATVHDENTPRETVASSHKIGASPVSTRKGRAAAIGSQQRRRRALSSIGNQQAVLQR
eukprot:COSAG02_NODE_4_length_69935_cov_46.806590_2_plen_1109_part_00